MQGNNAIPQSLKRILKDQTDGSVNFVERVLRKGKEVTQASFEARYVRRQVFSPSLGVMADGDKISDYVSVSGGCNQGCKMCWLTELGATNTTHATLEGLCGQLDRLMVHYEGLIRRGETTPAKRLYVNFMARGDALASPVVLFDYPRLYDRFRFVAERGTSSSPEGGLSLRMNVSSIFPHTVPKDPVTGVPDLASVFKGYPVHLFYSLYIADHKKRRALIPNAMDPMKVLEGLAKFQQRFNLPVAVHGAVIKGFNDGREDSLRTAMAIRRFGLWGKYNQVRLNVHPGNKSLEEASQEDRDYQFEVLRSVFEDNARRLGLTLEQTGTSTQKSIVGPEALASCGTFYEAHDKTFVESA